MNKFLLSISKLLITNDEKLKMLSNRVNEILKNYVGPVLIALSGAAAIYVLVLGVQYAKSDSDDQKANLKKRFINMICGLLIMTVITILCMSIDWSSVVKVFGYVEETEN